MAEAQKEYGSIECRAKVLHYKPQDRISQADEQRVLFAGRYRVTEMLSLEKPGNDRGGNKPFVMGSNAQYRFHVIRRGDKWVLTEVAPPYDMYDTLQLPFALPMTGDSYHRLLGKSGTKVVSQSRVEWRGQLHDEWVLDTATEQWQTRELLKQRIGLFARPGHSHRIAGVRIYDPENLSNWLNEYVLEYAPGDEKWPPLRSLEEWVTDKTDWVKDKSAAYKPWRVTRYEVHSWNKLGSSTPGKEFTLSGYELPEPKTIPDSSPLPPGTNSINLTPISLPSEPEPKFWLWVTLGVLMLAVGVGFVWWRRRASSD